MPRILTTLVATLLLLTVALPVSAQEGAASGDIADDGPAWSTGIWDGEWDTTGGPMRLEQAGPVVHGSIEGQRGPLTITAEEATRNRLTGHYLGDVFWVAGDDEGRLADSVGGIATACSEPRDGVAMWGQIEVRLDLHSFANAEPQADIAVVVQPCDEAWREANPAYAQANQWLGDKPIAAPEGFVWAPGPAADGDRWTGDWWIDFGHLWLEADGDRVEGEIASPGGTASLTLAPADPGLLGDWADPQTHLFGEFRGGAMGAWLATFGDVPATWACPQAREGQEQWGELLIRHGGAEDDTPNRIDASWLPCDAAWRDANYDDDWWYDGEDRFIGWRLAPDPS
jgi:hypothetical protein